MRYLKEYRRNVYLDLLMSGRLNSYLADIEEQAQERFERLIEAGTGNHRADESRKCLGMGRQNE